MLLVLLAVLMAQQRLQLRQLPWLAASESQQHSAAGWEMSLLYDGLTLLCDGLVAAASHCGNRPAMRSLQLLRLLGANDCRLLLLLLNWHIHLHGAAGCTCCRGS